MHYLLMNYFFSFYALFYWHGQLIVAIINDGHLAMLFTDNETTLFL